MESFGQIKLEQLRAALRAHGPCLSDEQLAAFLDNSLSQPEVARAESHLEACPRCATELSLLQEFRSAAPRPEEAAKASSITSQLAARFSEILGACRRALTTEVGHNRSRASRWREIFSPQSLVLASIVLVVATAALYLYRPQPPSLPEGLGTGPAILRSQKLDIVAPQGELSRVPRQLTWQPVAGAVEYEVRLMEVDGAEVWKTGSTGTSLAIPGWVRTKIIPGRTWLWQVVARDVSRGEIATSDIARFRLATLSRSTGS